MADNEVVTFTIPKNSNHGKSEVADRLLVRTPDGDDHAGLMNAIRAWFGVGGRSKNSNLRIAERDDA